MRLQGCKVACGLSAVGWFGEVVAWRLSAGFGWFWRGDGCDGGAGAFAQLGEVSTSWYSFAQ